MSSGETAAAAITETSGQHLSREAMAALASGLPGPEGGLCRETLLHLLGRCTACLAVYQDLQRLGREFGHWNWSIAVAEWGEAPELWRRLVELAYPAQLAVVEAEENYQTWGLCRWLQRRSGECVEAEPAQAARLAGLAAHVAEHLDAAYDVAWVRGLRAVCLACLGDARRELGELTGAADAFATARRLLGAGVGSPAFEAEVWTREALYARDRGQLHQAIELCAAAQAVFAGSDADAADRHLAGWALAHEAWCHHHMGRPDLALVRLDEAQRLVDVGRDPGLGAGIRLGQVWAALALGQAEVAAAVLRAAGLAAGWEVVLEGADGEGEPGPAGPAQRKGPRPGRRPVEPPSLAALRLRRAGARVAVAHGQQTAAKLILWQTADQLLGRGEGIEALMALFDLARLLILGEPTAAELERLAGEIERVLLTPIRPEGEQLPVIVLFRQACSPGHPAFRRRQGRPGNGRRRPGGEGCGHRLTADLIRQLEGIVELRRRPSLHWWSGSPIETGADRAVERGAERADELL
jgi:tetratricopeptide (TPR) repeat protein